MTKSCGSGNASSIVVVVVVVAAAAAVVVVVVVVVVVNCVSAVNMCILCFCTVQTVPKICQFR